MADAPVPPTRSGSPVRIRVYGLITLTKRGYLMMLATVLVLLAMLLTTLIVKLGEHYRLTNIGVTILVAVGIVMILAAIEAVLILRRFAREEALQNTQANPSSRQKT